MTAMTAINALEAKIAELELRIRTLGVGRLAASQTHGCTHGCTGDCPDPTGDCTYGCTHGCTNGCTDGCAQAAEIERIIAAPRAK